jgi:RNA-directed DNA polymerase
MDAGEFIATDGLGTPQGGVISPLMANLYLHSFDKMCALSGLRGTLVRYADDAVILVQRNGRDVLEQVRRMLGRLGLELHPEKTRVTTAARGFDFLGVHFRLCRVRKQGARLKQSCRIWPSDRSVARLKQKVKETIGRRYGESLEDMVGELNPILRGWQNYHTRVQPEPKRLRSLNRFVRERLRIFLKRKHSDPTRGHRRVPDDLLVRLGLVQLGRSLCFTGNGC